MNIQANYGPSQMGSAHNESDQRAVPPTSAVANEGKAFDKAMKTDYSNKAASSADNPSLNDPKIKELLTQLLPLLKSLIAKLSGGTQNATDSSVAGTGGQGAGGRSDSAKGAPGSGSSSDSTKGTGTGGAAPAVQGGNGKEIGFNSDGKFTIGKGWGGWDGVAAGKSNSSHDVKDRGNMFAVLNGMGISNPADQERVTTALHRAASKAGLDADKGTHSAQQAAQIKTQNHANIAKAFEASGPNTSADALIANINRTYGA